MVIKVNKDCSVQWFIYRKGYKKARWRRLGLRCLNDFLRFQEDHHGAHGLIIVK